jgi:CheY-like chemotaxis protein
MKSLLRELGYDVHTGGSIAEALALVESHTFDLIISDLGLPDGSGYDLMRTVMARHPTKGIALSGYAMAEDVMRGSGAGFVAHLSKPIRVEQLQKIIQSVIGTPGVPENLHGL